MAAKESNTRKEGVIAYMARNSIAANLMRFFL